MRHLTTLVRLLTQAQGLSPAQKTALRGAAFVPVANGTRLVAPEHMFSRLQLDLAPFAFEVRQLSLQPYDVLPGHQESEVGCIHVLPLRIVNFTSRCGSKFSGYCVIGRFYMYALKS